MSYTAVLEKPLDEISWEDDHFIDKLLEVAQLFRPFDEALTEFISERGYSGDPGDAEEKVAFIRSVFVSAGMDPPREIREWFTLRQSVRRDTVFQLCFAFGLDGSETDEFFRRIYARERSFNCHQLQEAVYYFCLNNSLSWADAQEILRCISPAEAEQRSDQVVYTGSIIAELNSLESKEELIAWLNENLDKFTASNVTSYETIRRLWRTASGPDGLLLRERRAFFSILDDPAEGTRKPLPTGSEGLRLYDAYLGILQLDKAEVKRLDTDRSIKPILEKLHESVRDSFPDRQGIDRILRGEPVSYERVRKWLVLLTFYTWWARRAVAKGSYEADPGDGERCLSAMNQHLIESGYPELYIGNPYDWIFFYASKCGEPLFVFRYIWNELLTGLLETHR